MEQIDELRKRLESEKDFQPLLQDFIKRSIHEQKEQESDSNDPQPYSKFYEVFIDSTSVNNVKNVFEFCESPIERIFLNSLILLFLKNQFIGLQIQAPSINIEQHISDYRTAHQNILSLEKQYQQMTGDFKLENFKEFFYQRIVRGEFTEEDFETFQMHTSIIKHFVWNSYHLTIQAGFPNFYSEGKGARADLLLWCPGDEDMKIIIECDGYKYHSSKSSFESDRKRDRIFQSLGYKVIRYSGTEIYRDPIEVASDLFNTITAIDKNEDRVIL